MRRIKSFLIIICLLSIYTAFLYGCERKERSDSHNNEAGLPEIVIGSDNYPPYNYVDTDGNATGIDVELATEAFKRMGWVFLCISRFPYCRSSLLSHWLFPVLHLYR